MGILGLLTAAGEPPKPLGGRDAPAKGPFVLGSRLPPGERHPPRRPPRLPRPIPRKPRPAAGTGRAVASSPALPTGIHGVRPPLGGPHVTVPNRAERRVATASSTGATGPSGEWLCVPLSWFAASCSAWRVAAVSVAASLSPETPRASCVRADDDRCAHSDGGCPCRSQPRRGPGEPGPSPAPGRLGAGWARSFFFNFDRAAPEESPFAGPGNSPTAWPCSCLLAAAAAAGILAHAPAVIAPSAIGASPCSPVVADTTGVTGVGDADSATSAVCSGSAPNLVPSASTCATRGVAEGETESASKTAAETPADTWTAALSAAGTTASTATDFPAAAILGSTAAACPISASSISFAPLSAAPMGADNTSRPASSSCRGSW
ncbi:unnamed protein product [Closterium sp. NIES-64]|nr:unnamed protein product [Closterium sp. NIES-64]